MATIAELWVKIGADVADLERALSGLGTKVQQKLSPIGRALDAAVPASKALAKGLAGLSAATGGAAIKGIQLAASMEQSKIAFTTMLGSAEAADKFLRELWDFAARTPFEFEGLQQSSRMLLAFGFQAKDIIPTMTAVGNAVAGLGGGEFEIQRVVRALGQMRAKGKVSAEEMMQLAETGIPAWEMLAKAIGTDIPTAMKLAEKGAIPAGTAIKGIVDGMMTAFPDMMAKQSTTLLGQWSTLKDNIAGALRTIGEEIIKTFDLKTKLASAIEALGRLSDLLSEKGLKGALAELFPADARAKIVMIAGAIGGALTPAFWALASGIIAASIPLIPFMAVGAALAGLAWLIWTKWEPLKEFFVKLWNDIKLIATDTWNSIAGFFSATWQSIKDTVTGTWADIKMILVGSWQSLKEAAVTTWNAIADFFREWWGVILLGIVTGGVGLLALIIWKNWDLIKEKTAEAWTALKDWLATTWENIKQAAMNAWDAMVNFIPSAWASIKASTVQAWEDMKQWLATTWENIKATSASTWEGMKDFVVNFFPRLKTAIVQGFQAIAEWFEELPARALEWGRNLMQAFVRGIGSISIPLPSFSISWHAGPGGISIPSLDIGVNWRALRDLVPFLAEGGIALRPTLAVIGERGPEAVVPLNRRGIGPGININITGNYILSDYDVQRLAEEKLLPAIHRALLAHGVR